MYPLWGERAPGPRRQPLHYGQKVNPGMSDISYLGSGGDLGSGIWRPLGSGDLWDPVAISYRTHDVPSEGRCQGMASLLLVVCTPIRHA